MSGVAGIVDFRQGAPKATWLRGMQSVQLEPCAHSWAKGPARFSAPGLGVWQERVLLGSFDVYAAEGLRSRLARTGREPAVDTAELLAQAWNQWGDGLLERLNGDFALATWDPQRAVLHLARDRVGARPLFYTWLQGRLAFASELRALLRLPWVSKELAREHLAEQLAFRYVHAPRTLLRDVRLLPAGSLATVDAGGVILKRWHRARMCPADSAEPPEQEVQARLESLLDRAVARRANQGGVGVLLSGGGASSAILGMAAKMGPARSYNVSFSDGGQDEASFAGRIAKIYGSEHTLIRLDRADFVEALDQAIPASSAPLPTPAAIIQWLLIQRTGTEGVLLSGDGADELLGGRRVEELMIELRASGVAANLPTGLRGGMGRLLGRKGQQLMVGPERFGLVRHVGGSNIFGQQGRKEVLRDPSLVRPGVRRQMLEPLYREVRSDPVNEVLHVYQRGWLPHNSLARARQAAASAGVDLRFPLLDPELLDYLDMLPGRAKVKRRLGRWQSKWPLKQLNARELPPRLVWRPKRRMPAPLDRWLRGDGEAFLWERVSEICQDPHRIFQQDAIRRLAREHAAGDADHGAKLWTLIFLDGWLRSLS